MEPRIIDPQSSDPRNSQFWACGSNTFGQLDHFNTPFEPYQMFSKDDVRDFKIILQAPTMSFIYGGPFDTLFMMNSGFLGQIKTGYKFGPEGGDQLALFLSNPVARENALRNYQLEKIVRAGNDKISTMHTDGNIRMFENWKDFEDRRPSYSRQFDLFVDLVANQTAFHGLMRSGDVFSWGDIRFMKALGRGNEAGSQQNPTSTPVVIQELRNRGPVRKITSAGFWTAAVNCKNELWMWGESPKYGPKLVPLFDIMIDTPQQIPVLGCSILDVALGDGYILVLTVGKENESNRLFVMGDNSSGQLGVGSLQVVNSWKEVFLDLQPGRMMRNVYTGYRNSFVLVDKVKMVAKSEAEVKPMAKK